MWETILQGVEGGLIGIFFGALVWLSGRGVVEWSGALSNRYSYPIGLLLTIAVSVSVVLEPFLSIFLVICLLALCFRGRLILKGLTPMSFIAFCFPVLIICIVQAIRYRGAGPDWVGNPLEDTVQYVGNVFAFSEFGDTRNLLVNGFSYSLAQFGPVFIASAVYRFIDPYFFFSSAVPAFFITAMGIGLFQMKRKPSDNLIQMGFIELVLVSSSVGYVSWLTESPGIAFALPLAFGVTSYFRNDSLSHLKNGLFFLVVLVAAYFTKIVLIGGLGAFMAFVLIKRLHAELSKKTFLTVSLVFTGVLMAAFSIFILKFSSYLNLYQFEFYPTDSYQNGRFRPEVFLNVVCQIVILAVYFLNRQWLFYFFSLGIIMGFWFWSSLLGVNYSLLLILIAFKETSTNLKLKRFAPVFLLIAGFSILAVHFREPFALRFAPGIILAGLIVSAWMALNFKIYRKSMIFLFGAGLLGLVGLLGTGRLGSTLKEEGQYLPYHWDIWNEVYERTPKNALIFTSMTGDWRASNGIGAQNYFAAMGRRQIYIAGWKSSPLSSRPVELSRRLKYNESVLRGEILPDYSGPVFVVIQKPEHPQKNAPLYENEEFSLVKIK